MIPLKCCTQYASTFGKLSSGHGTRKGQFSFQSKRKAMQRMLKLPHNCTHLTRQQSNAQNCPSEASTVCEPRTFRCLSWLYKRQRNQRLNCQHPLAHRKKQENSRKTSTSALLTTPKPLTVWITTSCGKLLKRWKNQTTLPAS